MRLDRSLRSSGARRARAASRSVRSAAFDGLPTSKKKKPPA
jgi:hypothetical protein